MRLINLKKEQTQINNVEAGKLLKDLEKEDLRILMAIEVGMKRSEFVPIKNIRFYSRYPIEETQYRLDKVHKAGLTVRNSSEYRIGYKLNSFGYDVLALHTLVEKEIISQLGPLLGKGKESDVYSCMDDDENIFALKIYRIGRTSFKSIKKYRNLIGERSHLSWLYVNRLAARKEYRALQKIYKLNLNTPKPIGHNRHIVVMEYLRGKELAYYKDIDKPQIIFKEIVTQMKKIYQETGLVHGDLGEFNIVADEKGEILIIDWLQSIPRTHPNAGSILMKDLQNLCVYFKNKWNISCDSQELYNEFIS